MKALFGAVSLLVVLALAGLIAARQLRSAGHPAAAVGVAVAPQLSGSGTAGQQSVELQRKVADDVAKAMNQAQTRRQEADQ